eukprot:g824.t1
MVDQNVADFRRAIASLQNMSDARARQRADEWLKKFQNSVIAWHVVDKVLTTATASGEDNRLIIFSAITLHHKIISASKVVQENLCMALAQLAVQDESWTNVLSTLVPMFDQTSMGSLLRIMKLIPEECRSRRCTASRSAQGAMMQELNRSSGDVIKLLADCMRRVHSSDVRMIRCVFECLSNWLRFTEIPASAMQNNPLLIAPFDAIQNSELFEVAVDTVCEVIRTYADVRKHAGVIRIIIPHVMRLQALYGAAIKRGDEDTARGVARIFTETGEAYLDILLGSENVGQQKVVAMILACAQHPSPEIVKVTFHFWYVFAEGLDVIRSNELRLRRLADYAPTYQKLASLCLKLLELPNDFDRSCDDDVDTAERFRGEVGDILCDCCLVLGVKRCGPFLLENLTRRCKDFVALTAQARSRAWRSIEAALCAFTCASKEITRRNIASEVTDSLIGGNSGALAAALHLHRGLRSSSDDGALAVRNACLGVLERYASWFRRQPQQFLQAAFEESVASLALRGTQAAASRVFCEICASCGGKVCRDAKMLTAVLHVHRQAVQTPLPKDELLRVTRGLASIVKMLEPKIATEALQQLLRPCKAKLASAAKNSSAADMILLFDTFTEVFAGLGGVSDAVKMTVYSEVESIWTMLGSLASVHGSNGKVAEKLCRFYKHMIRCLGTNLFKRFAHLFCKQTVALFKACRQSPYLYASGIAVESLAQVQDRHDMLQHMLAELSRVVLSLLTSLDAIRSNPDVVEDFFDFVVRYVKNCPMLLLKSPCVLHIVRLAASTLDAEHREANRSAIFFLESFLALGVLDKKRGGAAATKTSLAPILLKFLGEHDANLGRFVVLHVMRGTAGLLPLDRVDDDDGSLTSVLFVLRSLVGQAHFASLVNGTLRRLPESLARAADKSRLLDSMFGERGVSNSAWKNPWYRAMLDFSRSCARFQRTVRDKK